jgi:hypothetical protein
VHRNFPHVLNLANLALNNPIKQACKCTRPSMGNTGNSGHWVPPSEGSV